jgi:hypothetical protein
MGPLILVGLVAGGALLYLMQSKDESGRFPIATYEDEYGNIVLSMYGVEYANGHIQINMLRGGESAYIVFSRASGELVREGGNPQLLSEMHNYLQLMETETIVTDELLEDAL